MPAGEEGLRRDARADGASGGWTFELLAYHAPQQLLRQLLVGLINGAFYAMLSLGLAVIFGMLNIINFTHGAQYMMGAFCAWLAAQLPRHRLLVGADPRADRGRDFGMVLERLLLRHLYKLDHLYGLLLTFGLALIIEGLFRQLIWLVRAALSTFPTRSPARRISASCSCRTTAAG